NASLRAPRRLIRAMMRPRGTILQPGFPFRPEPGNPLGDRATRDLEPLRDTHLSPPLLEDKLDHLQPALRGQRSTSVGNVRHEDLCRSNECGNPYRYRRSSPHPISPRCPQPPWEEHLG